MSSWPFRWEFMREADCLLNVVLYEFSPDLMVINWRTCNWQWEAFSYLLQLLSVSIKSTCVVRFIWFCHQADIQFEMLHIYSQSETIQGLLSRLYSYVYVPPQINDLSKGRKNNLSKLRISSDSISTAVLSNTSSPAGNFLNNLRIVETRLPSGFHAYLIHRWRLRFWLSKRQWGDRIFLLNRESTEVDDSDYRGWNNFLEGQ